MNLFFSFLTRSLFLLFSLLFVPAAYACSACEDRVCLGSICGCVLNVGRCPPKIPEPERFPFCNITKDGYPNDKPSCINCSSVFSGDAGKVDCLARHQGNYVQFGRCVPAECRNGVGSASVGWSQLFGNVKDSQAKLLAPQLTKAEGARILELDVSGGKAAAKATAAILGPDGSELRCSYEMIYSASKNNDHKGLQFNVRSETCSPTK